MKNSVMNGAKRGAEAVTFFGTIALAYYGVKGTVNLIKKGVDKLMASRESDESIQQPEPPKKEEAAEVKKEEVKPTEEKVEESTAG